MMARRLTLEGAQVLGVYEAKPTPSGLTRNLHQCLYDYDIPLYLSHTVTRVFGVDRLEGVEISEVDEHMTPIAGTAQRLDCDALILSVGLIPENELAEGLGVVLDPKTKGPVCDGQCMTSVDGVFSCGNALHVNDLVDYVSENAAIAGAAAAQYEPQKRTLLPLQISQDFLYMVPQQIDLGRSNRNTAVYFRARSDRNNTRLSLTVDGKEVFSRRYAFLRPPEMEKLELDFDALHLTAASDVRFTLEQQAQKEGTA